MTDKTFTELVNLYLDQEITEEQLQLLKLEIANNSERKRLFLERTRLHQALRLALNSSQSAPRKSASRRNSTRVQASASSSDSGAIGTSEPVLGLPRWLLPSGLAASLVLGVLVLTPLQTKWDGLGSQSMQVRNSQAELALPDMPDVPDAELLLGASELRRYAVLQEQREMDYRASLVAQMRLMGLRPELTPEDKQLEEVQTAAFYKPTQRVSQAEHFQRIQALKSIPEPQLLRIEASERKANSPFFDAALVSFEGL